MGSPSALPSFQQTWIGGDIHGLSALVGTLYGYIAPVTTVRSTLDSTVDGVVHDAGWYGDAASAFKAAWSNDSLAAEVLIDVLGQFADTVDGLAVALATYEHTLEAAAATAIAAGVEIGPDGGSLPVKPPLPPLLPDAANKAVAAGNTYESVRTYLLGQAHLARQDVVESLDALTTKIVPEKEGLSKGDDVVVADFVRGLYAVPSAYRKAVEDELANARSEVAKAKAAWRTSRDATPPGQKMPDDVKAALRDARGDLDAVHARLDGAVNGESRLPGSKLLDLRFSDAAAALGRGGADSVEGLARASKFLGDIPVVDGLAVLAGTYFGTESDLQKGGSLWPSLAENAGANVVAVGAGAAAGIAVGGAIAGTAVAGAPVLAVVGGAVVGGAVAVGVGDLAINAVHEDWGTDISQRGVRGGLAHGTSDVVSNTGHDLENMGKSIWHGVFG